MHPVSVAIFFGLIASVGWGLSDFYAAKASKKFGPFGMLLPYQVYGSALMILVFLLGESNKSLPMNLIWSVAGLALLFAVGEYLLFVALEAGPVSVTSPISASYAMAAALIAVTFLHERLVSYQWLAIVTIFVGLLLASSENNPEGTQKSRVGIYAALGTIPAWGLFFALLHFSVSSYGWLRVTMLQFIFTAAWTAVYMLARQREGFKQFGQSLKSFNVVASTVAGVIAFIGFNYGIEHSLTALITPVSSTYPLLTLTLALVVFREKVRWHQILGALVIVTGLVILAAH